MAKSKNIAISVHGISKTFKIPHERYNSLKQNAIHLFSSGRRSYKKFEAVKELTFDIYEGEFFGIVGRNGSGKSTLLKMLAGIYVPNTGRVKINGALSPFIELGVGFNPELSAHDNIYLNGAILGLTRKEIAAKFDDIISFAELEEFVDQKLKNYSSGMQVRLAFSIAIQAQSDILLVDEVLAVGDAAFQKKCMDVFSRLKKEGKTIVFVTHDMSNVEKFCDRVLVVENGKPLGLVGPNQASNIYSQLNAESSLREMEELKSQSRWGSGEVRIKHVTVMDAKGKTTPVLRTGDAATIRIELEDFKPGIPILVGLAVYASDGMHLAGPNSKQAKLTSRRFVDFTIDQLPLTEGNYELTVAIFGVKNETNPYDYIDRGFNFAVIGLKRELGAIALFGDWSSHES